MDIEKCQQYINEYSEMTQTISNKIFDEVKSGTKTYNDVKTNIDKLMKTVRFNLATFENSKPIFNFLESLINKDIDDLPSTNRLSD